MRVFLKGFKNIKLRNRILIPFLALVFLSVFVASSLFYIKTSELLLTQSKKASTISIDQASNFISYKLNNAKDASSLVYLDTEMNNLIAETINEKDQFKKYENINMLTSKLINMNNGRDIYNIRLYIKDESFTSSSGSKVINESAIKNEDWYYDVIRDKGGLFWIPTYNFNYDTPRYEKKIVTLARSLYLDGETDHVGILMVDILEETLREIINKVEVSETGSILVIDKDRDIITSKNSEPTNLNKDKLLIESIPSEILNNNTAVESHQMTIEGQSTMVFHQRIKNMDWQILAVVPISEITKDSKDIFNFMLPIILIITTLTIYLAFKISNTITKRVQDLSDNMNKIQNEDWNIKIEIDSEDEIGDLQKNFAYMINSMQFYIKEKFETEIMLRKADLRALQAQINPHFLYNILDMINWMALKHDAEDISFVVSRLAKFFRLSLSSGNEMVQIRDEIEHIQLYIDIQQKRFGGAIETDIAVDEDILDYYTIKTILQPLIENAIQHGIREKADESGIVVVRGWIHEDTIVISIYDNGIGISEEKINEILVSTSDGYGVRNINERLTLTFGPKYGLHYESVIGVGTAVFITIPISEESDIEAWKGKIT